MTSMTSAPENPLPLGRPGYNRTLSRRIIGWLRANLFASIPSSIMSLLLIALLGKAFIGLVQWATRPAHAGISAASAPAGP
jgi:general L-amino acid transport system permease protein